MKHGLMHALGFVTAAALLALGAGPASADSAGPYYATPSWDQQLPASTRFVVLSNWASAAVLDRETGLVWERSPDIAGGPNNNGIYVWTVAQAHCNGLKTGGRLGWRLPTLQELASLVDPTVPFPGIALPTGHPFSNVLQQLGYWSGTTDATNSGFAWVVGFSEGGGVGGLLKSFASARAWCVRGGQGVDPQ